MRQAESTRSSVGQHRLPGSIGFRLILSLVLIPIVPAIAGIGAIHCIGYAGRVPFDDMRWLNLFMAALWLLGTILIWRAVVLWTLGRRIRTAMIGMIPLAQVIYGQSLWDTGCGVENNVLRFGQGSIGVGLWIWLGVWVWWGWEKSRMASEPVFRRVRMTPTAKRLAASIGSLPFVVGASFIMAIGARDWLSMPGEAYVAYALTLPIAVGVWLMIWRRAVAWSSRAIAFTSGGVALLMVLPICILWLFRKHVDEPWETTINVLPVMGWGIWMAVTVRYWPAREQVYDLGHLTPHCPKCDYSLRGLSSTRCPECGHAPTLDALWQATAGEGE